MAHLLKTTLCLAGALLAVVGVQHFTASPVVLQASVDSVAGNGEWLTLRADGTFDHTSAGLFSETITHGRYTRTDRLIQLDRLPEEGALQRKTLRVSASPAFETGKGLWQVGSTGRIDSTLTGLRIVYHE
ncbi:MAG TPA: hypothetical protein VF690_04385 [Hymenobacter sp.]|jgi:hypothetical protein